MSQRSAALLVSLANAVSLSRLVAAPVVVFLVWRSAQADSYRYAALWLVAVLQAGDMIDGYLARKGSRQLRVRNYFGEMIDPFADKTYIGAALVTLALTDQLSGWFVALAIARDAAILAGWTVIFRTYGVRILPNLAGKMTDATLALVIAAVLLRSGPPVLGFVTLGASGLVLYSSYLYGKSAWRVAAAARFGPAKFPPGRGPVGKRVGVADRGVGLEADG